MLIATLPIYNTRNERNKHNDELQYPDTGELFLHSLA